MLRATHGLGGVGIEQGGVVVGKAEDGMCGPRAQQQRGSHGRQAQKLTTRGVALFIQMPRQVYASALENDVRSPC